MNNAAGRNFIAATVRSRYEPQFPILDDSVCRPQQTAMSCPVVAQRLWLLAYERLRHGYRCASGPCHIVLSYCGEAPPPGTTSVDHSHHTSYRMFEILSDPMPGGGATQAWSMNTVNTVNTAQQPLTTSVASQPHKHTLVTRGVILSGADNY